MTAGGTSASDIISSQPPAVPSTRWRNLSVRPRPGKLPKGLDAAWNSAVATVVPLVPRRRRFLGLADQVVALDKQYAHVSARLLREAAVEMRDIFRLGRQTPDDLIRAFAIVREVAWRQLEMRPYPVQVAAAAAMEAGCIAEMATGEGKTLAATMPATIAGWRGRGCHVITVNDYLAQRDAEWMKGIYTMCGLRVAYVTDQMPPGQRRIAYEADITYCTNKEVAADLLRDRLKLGRQLGLPRVLLNKIIDQDAGRTDQLVMRGLDTAIVDEADSVLIDEAVTPLIISGTGHNAQQIEAFEQAAQLAGQLEPGSDYTVEHRFREIHFTRAGRLRLAELTQDMSGIWAGVRRREELVNQALSARELFLLDKQYVNQDGKIVIVDEFTGRLMPDRSWRDGLHQAVEAKEKVEVTPPKETLARISFQRFHRLYRHLSGMTGTALEAQYELWRVYKLPVVPIPTHRPCIRERLGTRVFAAGESKWDAIVAHIDPVHATGRPLLIGTRSVGASEHLSRKLTDLGLEHQVLNAVRHAEEAAIVAGAGRAGRLTVATNMAGRGTDIKLERGVAEKGGLHVVATERHEAGRIDRQLFGRAARQGDPGSAVAFVALDDELIQRYGSRWAKRVAQRFGGAKGELTGALALRIVNRTQTRASYIAARQRQAVLKSDDMYDEFLGFAGSEH